MLSRTLGILRILYVWLPLVVFLGPATPARSVRAESEDAPVSESRPSVETIPSCRVARSASRPKRLAPPALLSFVPSPQPQHAAPSRIVFDGHKLSNGLNAPLVI
jgi:hypothetical protein